MRRLLLAVGLSVASAALLTAQPAADSPSAAARKRQDAIKSVEFVFKVEEIAEPGCMNHHLVDRKSSEPPYPAQQIRVSSENRLVVKGDRVLYTNNHPMPDRRTRLWESTLQMLASDGQLIKEYLRPTSAVTRQNSFGILKRVATESVLNDHLLLPMTYAVRGANAQICPLDIRDPAWHAVQQNEPVKARESWRGFSRGSSTSFTEVASLDSHSDMSLVRYRRIEKGSVTVQLDIKNKLDEGSGTRLPSEWKQTYFTPTGLVRRSWTVTVVELRVNADVPDSRFQIDFPANMEVDDQISGKSYVATDSGQLKPLRSSGGSVDSTPDSGARVLVLATLYTLIIGFAGLKVWRRRRRGRSA